MALMNQLDHFEVIGKRAFYRPSCRVDFEQAVGMVAAALKLARELELRSILVNTSGFAGIAPPSIFDRHSMVLKWAESAGSQLHVALVARAELIDPDRIGLLMAQNRGVSTGVFTTEVAAVAWLESRHVNQV